MVGGILGGIAKTIGGSILGGVASGLSRRAEAQVAGKKAAQYGATPAGYQGHQQAQIMRDQVHAIGSQQRTSQGQSLAFQDLMQQNQFLHQAQMQNKEHQQQRWMMNRQLSHDQQMNAGQSWLSNMLSNPYNNRPGINPNWVDSPTRRQYRGIERGPEIPQGFGSN